MPVCVKKRSAHLRVSMSSRRVLTLLLAGRVVQGRATTLRGLAALYPCHPHHVAQRLAALRKAGAANDADPSLVPSGVRRPCGAVLGRGWLLALPDGGGAVLSSLTPAEGEALLANLTKG